MTAEWNEHNCTNYDLNENPSYFQHHGSKKITSNNGSSKRDGRKDHTNGKQISQGPQNTYRTIYIGNKPPPSAEVFIPHVFPDNCVVTSKYTAWNFIPKNMFEQFRRIANFYFLCIAIIQLSIKSPVSPATSLTPLIFVVTVTAIKQAYEDWLRHKADKLVNELLVFVVRNGKLMKIMSKDITVGDIVRVRADEGFPCDLVLLSSSDRDGQCLITTANLDGETNLKVHRSLAETREFNTVETLSRNVHTSIECHEPSADLYKFVGRMNIYNADGSPPKVSTLGPENLLLKGARLKNTAYVFGCAVYTGQQTKMALNSKLTGNKFSTVERSMNRYLIVFLIVLMIETSCCVGLKYWYRIDPVIGSAWYLPSVQHITFLGILQDFFAFLVLFNYIIPISLYVSLEMVKFIGSMFFVWDIELYDERTNQPAKCNSSDLNEELGQVEYLFTDKTGTLTENNMQFRQCSVNSVQYVEQGGLLCQISECDDVEPTPLIGHYPEDVEMFLEVLALCHTVHVSSNIDSNNHPVNNGDLRSQHFEYQASSPDEKALVEACRRLRVAYQGFSQDNYELVVNNKLKKYRLLHVLEFDSDRKRMSVILQNEKDEIYLLCKGAESTVLDLTTSGPKTATLHHVDNYAILGLRTLVVACKKLSSAEFAEFNEDLNNARNALSDREEKVNEVFLKIEKGLRLLGATAVEDQLQDGVAETLEALRIAGIKIWVLTGDKQETAINISHSCGHFKSSMIQLQLTQQVSKEECGSRLVRLRREIQSDPSGSYALVVDGMSLIYALHDHSELFSEVCMSCTAVLCCRMSPIQKAEVVKLIKRSSGKPITAAIGDGANDVSMIQEAHVGLGIMGKEGRQATRCSDFAFARFRFLLRVLLVHGQYYYIRVANLVQYFFYKNVAFITPQVIYTFYSAFSEQTIYHSIFLMFYNLFFTALPILIYGISEQHIKQSTLISNPKLYKTLSCNAKLSPLRFVVWVLIGLWHSLVFFYGVYFLFRNDVSLRSNGQMDGLLTFGTLVFHICVITVNVKLCLHTRYWTIPFVMSILASVIGFILFSFLYCGIKWPLAVSGSRTTMYWMYMQLFSSVSILLASLLLIVIALLPDVLFILVDNHSHLFKNHLEKVSTVEVLSKHLGETTPLRPKSKHHEICNHRGIIISTTV